MKEILNLIWQNYRLPLLIAVFGICFTLNYKDGFYSVYGFYLALFIPIMMILMVIIYAIRKIIKGKW